MYWVEVKIDNKKRWIECYKKDNQYYDKDTHELIKKDFIENVKL